MDEETIMAGEIAAETKADTVAEAVEAVVEEAISDAEATTEAVVEAAAESIEAAQETAEEIARAAIETALGNRITLLEERISEWMLRDGDAHQKIEALMAQLTEMSLRLETLSSSTPATLTMVAEEVPEASPTVEPETASQNDVAESPAQPTKPKRRRLI